MRLFIFRVLFERFHLRFSRTALILFLLFSGVLSAGAQSSFTVGTYNLERFNPEKNENINHEGAKAFQKWIVSEETQELIGQYGVEEFGSPLFTPDAQQG